MSHHRSVGSWFDLNTQVGAVFGTSTHSVPFDASQINDRAIVLLMPLG